MGRWKTGGEILYRNAKPIGWPSQNTSENSSRLCSGELSNAFRRYEISTRNTNRKRVPIGK
jgi:hypothetical protein